MILLYAPNCQGLKVEKVVKRQICSFCMAQRHAHTHKHTLTDIVPSTLYSCRGVTAFAPPCVLWRQPEGELVQEHCHSK